MTTCSVPPESTWKPLEKTTLVPVAAGSTVPVAVKALLREGTRGLDPATDSEAWALAVHNLGVVLLNQGRTDEAKS